MIFIDVNLGVKGTDYLIKKMKPDISIVSHYHSDHSNWGSLILETSETELYVPEGEEDYLKSLEYFIRKTAGSHELRKVWMDFTINVMRYEEMEGFQTYCDLHRFRSGDVLIECLRTPGHSPSHTSFYFPEQKILFAGDMGLGYLGPWYGWNDCNICQHVESILKLKSLETEVLMSSHHGIAYKDIDQIWDRCLRIILKREKFIREELHKGKKKQEIVEQGIYFRNVSEAEEPMKSFRIMWDTIMFEHHREILERDSLINIFPELVHLIKEGI